MNGFLVDTNVISEFIRPQLGPRVIRWLEATDPESLFASVVTFGESRAGIEDLPVGRDMTMKPSKRLDPIHPGEILLEDFIGPALISI